MDYVTLGRTGLRASVLGLGGGGHSRLGQQTGATETQSVAIVRQALELGVNFIDTAEAYGTEAIVGEALRGIGRQDVLLSTKKTMTSDGRLMTADDLTRGLDASLACLGTDYLDVYHLHGVKAKDYDYAVAELVPAMIRQREQGKVRFLGITEGFAVDTAHVMMAQAIRDPYWDVVMVGFNILNQSARDRVLAEARAREIGVLCMFAVRDALSQPEKLRQTVSDLLEQGLIERGKVDAQDPLGFLLQVEGIMGLPDAAYRFCRAEPGIHVVLSGTGNPQHLEQNVASILSPALPEDIRQQLVDIFAQVDTVSGQ